MNAKRASDDIGLVAELLHHAPALFRDCLLLLYNKVLLQGPPPESWRRTFFQMLPKTSTASAVSDYRPIASVRVLYKLFAYLMLGRLEHELDKHQPEEQHAFRADYRIEEHLLTANMFLDKTRSVGIPVWAVSLDLSKAFDRVDWSALWSAMRGHGISDHLIWVLQVLYENQTGQVKGNSQRSDPFDIRAGVRQGCVLSPRLFCCLLEWAMARWQRMSGTAGFDLGDGLRRLLDLRFADDVVFFAKSQEEAAVLLTSLVDELATGGLMMNADKTVVLTTEAQPPDTLLLPSGVRIKRVSSHKWLGCILSTDAVKHDQEYHLQAATRAFYASRWVFTAKHVSISSRLNYFHAVITPIALFGSAHRVVYADERSKLNVACRKLLRQIVGPPGGADWTGPWHEILHSWHERVYDKLKGTQAQLWSDVLLRQYWSFAGYVANLPAERWLSRVREWSPAGSRRQGRPRKSWEYDVQRFCNEFGVGDWRVAARDVHSWKCMADDFRDYMSAFPHARFHPPVP